MIASSNDEAQPPGSSPPPPDPDSTRLAAGGIYIKWQGRLWQEQPDGTYLLWNEDSHAWEKSQRQPPREGGAVQTKECTSCGRRIKSTFRVCPHCGFTFPVRAKPQRRVPQAAARDPWYQKPVPNWVAMLLAVLMVGTTGYVVISLNRGDPCERWDAANQAFARNAARAQGDDPQGAELDRLVQRYESRFSAERPEGC